MAASTVYNNFKIMSARRRNPPAGRGASAVGPGTGQVIRIAAPPLPPNAAQNADAIPFPPPPPPPGTEANAGRRGLALLAQAGSENGARGAGGLAASEEDGDEEFEGSDQILFSVDDIPVSRRSGEHARLASEGTPELVFDKSGVTF